MTYDVPCLNINAHDLFELARSFAVRDHTQKKECDKKIAEIAELIVEANGVDTKGLSASDVREIARAVDKLNIAKNYFLKAVGSYNAVQENQKRAEENLAKKRKDKEALIAKRQEEMKVRNDNRKKKEAEDAALKAKK